MSQVTHRSCWLIKEKSPEVSLLALQLDPVPQLPVTSSCHWSQHHLATQPLGHLIPEALPTIRAGKQLRLAGHSLNSLMQLFQEVNNRTLCPSRWERRARVWPGGHSLFWPFCPNLGSSTVASGAQHKKLQNQDLNTLPAPLSTAAPEPLVAEDRRREETSPQL